MKKALYLIFITVFIALCMTPLAGRVLGYENVNAEKRALAAAPAFAQDGEVNLEFTREFDDYFTDNFAFRPDLVTLYAKLNALLFSESVSEQVIIGKDGWMFFTPTVNDYIKEKVMTDNEVYRLVRTLEIEKEYLAQRGAAFIFTIAPNKSSIYGQYMPDGYTIVGGISNAEKLSAALTGSGVDYVDLFAVLRAQAGEAQIYHKLDTHWNNMGALTGYNALLAKVQELYPEFSFDTHAGITPDMGKTWKGDLSDMIYPTANMLDEQYDYGIEKEYKTERPMMSAEDMAITARCTSGSLDALMFRDSFANALIPLLSNEFASITYSRAVPYDFGRMEESTDVVILEIVERNLTNIIAQAPILSAPSADISAQLTPAEIDTRINVQDSGSYIKITGVALPSDYSADKNYDVYIRLSSSGQAYDFTPFPILDSENFSELAGNANCAFSMMLLKDALPNGDYTISVIMRDGGEWYIDDEVGTTVKIEAS